MPEKSVLPALKGMAASAKLHVFSCYGDIPTSARARRTACAIAKLAGPHWRTISEMWKIDAIQASAPIRVMIANEAANADVIIIAISSLSQSEPALTEWFNALQPRQPDSLFCGLLIGLPGDDETSATELGSLVTWLRQLARHAGRDFIWHRMEPGAADDADWLTDSVRELLSRKLWFEVFGGAIRRLAARGNVMDSVDLADASRGNMGSPKAVRFGSA